MLDRATALDWLSAAAISAGVFFALELVKWIGRAYAVRSDRRLGRRSLLRALPARLLGRSNNVLLTVFALFAGSYALDLPPTPERIVHGVVLLAVLFQVGLWLTDMIAFFALRYQERSIEQPERSLAPGTIYALRFLGSLVLWSVLLLFLLDNLGVEITTLVAGLGIGGIAIALAAQSMLSDFFASLVIVFDRPFAIGDFIVVDSYLGDVERIGVKTTRVRSLSGEELIFSNNDLVSSRIRNYRRMIERRILFTVGLVYGTKPAELERAITIVREAIERQERTRLDRVHFKGFGDSSLDIEAVYYVLDREYIVYMDAQQAINFEILNRFTEEGFDFAFPSHSVYMHVEGMDETNGARSPSSTVLPAPDRGPAPE
jgi:small-conductance mechanosensitive channel